MTRRRAALTLTVLVIIGGCLVSNPVLHAVEAAFLLTLILGIPAGILGLAGWCVYRLIRPRKEQG